MLRIKSYSLPCVLGRQAERTHGGWHGSVRRRPVQSSGCKYSENDWVELGITLCFYRCSRRRLLRNGKGSELCSRDGNLLCHSACVRQCRSLADGERHQRAENQVSAHRHG